MRTAEESLSVRLLADRPELRNIIRSGTIRNQFDRFGRMSPLFRALLLAHPDWVPWLIDPAPPLEELRPHTIHAEWDRYGPEHSADEKPSGILSRLRLFRRRMSMRIAFRDVNSLYQSPQTVRELSLLADFCLNECLRLAVDQWKARYGDPWDEALNRPARFCVLALGKLGGRELNFSSDIDLIYFYEGDGPCRKDDGAGSFSSAQFFTKVAETMTGFLQEQTPEGFLFRVDLRLRPEGARSPLVRSLAGMENYYAAAGQSWERMALIKARPVAGDLSLGGELLEGLHSFRYPRHAPPSLLSEIAAMKLRTEKEVVGAENLKRDVKSGYGGIREIEFIVQTLQLLHAGRFPFLQTNSTVDGLDQLVRYRLMDRKEAGILKEAYWFLRTVENRIQIKEEQQRHALPMDSTDLAAIAESFGFADPAPFLEKLDRTRETVRAHYSELLRSSPVDETLAEWWSFFSQASASERVERALTRWFGRDGEEAAGVVRDFVQGDRNRMLTREQVSRFTGLINQFDRVFPSLAFPLRSLQRISRFADAYGTRSHFLSACSLNPSFLEVLALLFDRSDFICELICQFPEIFEEVLRPEILRRRKSAEDTLHELELGAEGRDRLEDWLWLYVKAEQVRIAIGDLLGLAEPEATEASLSSLSDAVLMFLLRRFDPNGSLLAVALGKYGGEELTFGSDLDILFVGTGENAHHEATAARRIAQVLSHRGSHGPIYEIDLRLRPHGKDGPLTPGIKALRKYFSRHAQCWEIQVLTRARPVAGNPALDREFRRFIEDLIYKDPTPAGALDELWKMRERIERERDPTDPPERSFKTGAGGLIDIEFLCQFIQMREGFRHPELRTPNTRRVLKAILELNLLDPNESRELLDNFNFLKKVEVLLRRGTNSPITVIPESPGVQRALAHWIGFKSYERFWSEHVRRMSATRRIVQAYLSRCGVDY